MMLDVDNMNSSKILKLVKNLIVTLTADLNCL